MIGPRFSILVIFFTASISAFAEFKEFDHVALLECDQEDRLFKLRALGKGDADAIVKSLKKSQAIYLFNKHNAKLPDKHRLCIVRITSEGKLNFRRRVTWLRLDKPLEQQLRNHNFDDPVIERILEEDTRTIKSNVKSEKNDKKT